jgi:hypothetical membrane protein
MIGMPKWGLGASVAAPAILIGGWTAAAAVQPAGYSQVGRTISALAARGVPYRWVMTIAFILAGLCVVATAIALRPAAARGRAVLAAGGVSLVLVGLNPLPAPYHDSVAHSLVVAAAFWLLALWPLLSWRQADGTPWGLRPAVSVAAGCVLLVLTCLLCIEVLAGGSTVGAVQRVTAASETVWPCLVAVCVVTATRRVRVPISG